jgi:hypothetical protein
MADLHLFAGVRKANCFLLLVTDLLGCFNVKGSDVKLEVHVLASYCGKNSNLGLK